MRKLLLVDDEPGIREALSRIHRHNDLDITTAATVSEALSAIMSCSFDVLISDLNVGEPGDGFRVISAMRHAQPNCRTFIWSDWGNVITDLKSLEDAFFSPRKRLRRESAEREMSG